ncbi:MAG: lamin tail domain-containing protein [Planctomycetales bacterium]|nr:lamin tail domain-containing protein [Planctomycetales bacterium]
MKILRMQTLENRLVLDSTVVFSELMYNPVGNQNLEWIELYNQMAVDMDISNWQIAGVDFTFPPSTILPAQSFVVVAKSPDDFFAAHGISAEYGPYGSRLSNGGESIRLLNNNGRVMDEVDYGDSFPWPVAADGSGASLTKVHLDKGSADPQNWTHSQAVGGSPRTFQLAPPSSLLLNEISQRNQDAFFVELANVGEQSVDLDGLMIASAGADNAFALSGRIEPGEYLAIDRTSLPFSTFDIDRLFLYSNQRQTVLDGVIVQDAPQARITSGEFVGEWHLPESPTPGAENSFQLESDVVINEIFYHAPGTAVDDQPATFETTQLLPIDASTTWRYRADADGLDLNWAATSHNVGDDHWQSGVGLFGYERATLSLPIRTEFPNPATIFPPIVTYYFETDFLIDESQLQSDQGIALRHMVDDGAVFYLNGEEFLRFNMPTGEFDSGTFAASVPDAQLSDTVQIPQELLRSGTNRLSVEVHQASVASNDVVFGAELLQTKLLTEFVPGQPYTESGEEWIEIYNRSDIRTIDLSGWQFTDGVRYTFPAGSQIGPGEFRLVARDADKFAEKYPEKASLIVGRFEGQLANGGESIRLVDAVGNPADQVRYYDDGRWHEFADGGGASLELISPNADNRFPESWTSSDNTAESAWQTVTYEGAVQPDGFSGNVSNRYQEFILGMLNGGELLVDDIFVWENGTGGINRIQNGSFTNDALGAAPAKWRIGGNHSGVVVADPDDPTNHVLRLTATGAMEDRFNHAETTFAGGARIQPGVRYQISYRVRWMGGSNQVHSHLYFDRLAKTTRLIRPETHGTPGQENSNYQNNIGPSFDQLSHSPILPAAEQPVTVSVSATDVDGVNQVTLFYAVEDGPFVSVLMLHDGQNRFSAVIPGQAAGDVVQFYVQGQDALGATAVFPASGNDSRALYQVPNQTARSGIHNFRILMTPSDSRRLHDRTNVLSNGRMGATVIYNESEVFYDVGIRLRGSNAGRSDSAYVGFHVQFDPMHLFRGVHDSVVIDRSGRSSSTPRTQDEILIKHIGNAAGGIPLMYDDLVHVIAPSRSHTRTALLLMARYGDEFLDSQFENGSDGTVFKLDIAYVPNGTTDGNPESPKVAFPYSHPQPTKDLQDLGDDKEAYRMHLQIENNRDRDDYSRIIEASRVLDDRRMPLTEIAKIIDIDQWARTFALQSLTGAADVYTRGGLHHNIQFYVRPSDNRVLAFPWDWDFAFTASISQSLIGSSGNGGQLMSRPGVQRLYHGHLLDLINTTFNNEYLDRWIDHYGDVARQNLGAIKTYVSRRKDFVLDRLPEKIDFQISTNDGAPLQTQQNSVTLEGIGWIDVRDIRIGETGLALDVVWLDDQRWQVTVPVAFGTNQIDLVAFDHRRNAVGRDSLTVTSTAQLGDINADGSLNADDIDLLALAIRLERNDIDLDGDGMLSFRDHRFLVEQLIGTDSGDANLDLVFNSQDLVLIFQTAEYEDGIPGNSTWTEGDWDGDGDFTSSDLVFAFQFGLYQA